jgi:hypothetical protein
LAGCTARQPNRFDRRATALELLRQGVLGESDLPVGREVAVINHEDHAALPDDVLEVWDRGAVVVLVPCLPTPHSGYRDTGQPFLTSLQRLFFALADVQRLPGIRQDSAIEQRRNVEAIRSTLRRSVSLPIGRSGVQLHPGIGAATVELRIREDETGAGAEPKEVADAWLRCGIQAGPLDRFIREPAAAELVDVTRRKHELGPNASSAAVTASSRADTLRLNEPIVPRSSRRRSSLRSRTTIQTIMARPL